MSAAAIIVFREVLEAALVVSIVLAATRGVAGRGRWVSLGVVLGLIGACLLAGFAGSIATALAGRGQAFLNAGILLTAVVMLGWHNIWMSRHGKQLAAEVKAVGRDVASGHKPLYMLMTVVLVAVLREGSETVLFMYGIYASGAGAGSMLLGGAIGAAIGVLTGAVLYFGLLSIPMKHLFTVTSWMILLLAAGMAADAAGFLAQAGVLPSLTASVWNTSAILTERSIVGQVLHILIGYNQSPSGIQLVFYLSTIVVIGGLMIWINRRDVRAARFA